MVKAAGSVLIVSHIDADGITSASIAASTCDRLGIPRRVRFASKLSEDVIAEVNASNDDLVWITDLGSGYLTAFERDGIVVTDHHVPDSKWRRGQTFLDAYIDLCQINPHCYGLDGSTQGCGAAMTYLLSRRIDPRNMDLAPLAVVGACGDIQDLPSTGLAGLNVPALEDAVGNGDVVAEMDLRLFGKETRSLIQFFQYSDPHIPGLGGDPEACAGFLDGLGIRIRDDGRARCWNDLSPGEKKRVSDAVLALLPEEERDGAVGPCYRMVRNPRRSELGDSKEYATLLNSCGRYDDAETGMLICMGDADAVKKAKKNRQEHRRNISVALSMVKERNLLKMRNSVIYFNAGSEIRDTVVGIVAGMVLNTEGLRKDMPIIAFADSDDGVKVSARADPSLVKKGLDLSSVMRIASEMVGGYGGGHNVAAGATIPRGTEEEFLSAVDDMVLAQLI